MRRYETTTKQVESTTLAEVTCDLCGTKAKTWNWDSSGYEVNETELTVTVRQKDGSSSREYGSGEEYVIDLCPACFKDRLVPWLKSQGAQIDKSEWDW